MPDSNVQNDPFGRDIMVQAFLYANGELDGTEALSFERCLGEDQAARDALCQAVVLCQPLSGQAVVRPNPVYRDRVRQRLRSGTTNWESLSKWGHPVLWGLLGAALAACLMLALQDARFPVLGNRTPGASTPENDRKGTVTNEADQAAPVFPYEAPSSLRDAPNPEPSRAPSEEEIQRKSRADESRRPAPPSWQRPRSPVRRAVTN